MIATLFFLLKISIPAILFYWRIDIQTFGTSRSSSPSQFVPEIISRLPSSPGLVCHELLFVYFFKELISFIGSLDKCHTSVFNALIVYDLSSVRNFDVLIECGLMGFQNFLKQQKAISAKRVTTT